MNDESGNGSDLIMNNIYNNNNKIKLIIYVYIYIYDKF